MRLLWVRMYPKWTRPGASYVVDRLPRLEIVDDRYGEAVAEVFDTYPMMAGFVNVEWDNAIDPGDVAAVERCVEGQPHVIWVAPYLGYGPEGQEASTNYGLGCTWLPRILFERFPGIREVRYPALDGEIVNAARRHAIEIRHVPDAHVKHLHW